MSHLPLLLAALAGCHEPDPYDGYETEALVPNGAYTVEVLQPGGWRPVGTVEQDEFLRERTFDLPAAGGDTLQVRIRKLSGWTAHLDAVTLDGAAPIGATPLLGDRDFDLVELPEEPVVLTFAAPDSPATLSVTARIEAQQICEAAFVFPEVDEFLSYVVGSSPGALKLDGVLDEVEGQPPFLRQLAPARTGHPTSDVIAWVRDDGHDLYVAIDFTGDNTLDGGKDFASLLVKTADGVREWKVTALDERHGVAGFGYTPTVGWAHKRYELAVPLAELGDPQVVELAFSTYGTCSPCGCVPPEVLDAGNRCCLPQDIGAAGFCCEYGVAPDGTCSAPTGPVFGLKDLDYTGALEVVSDVNDPPFPLDASAVGYSSDGRAGPGAVLNDAYLWNVGNRSGQRKRSYLPDWQHYELNVHSRAFGINDRGQVVGWFIDEEGSGRAYLLEPATAADYVPYEPDPFYQFTYDLQTYDTNLLLWTELAELDPTGDSFAIEINNADPPVIAGATAIDWDPAVYDPYGPDFVPALWENYGQLVLLDTLASPPMRSGGMAIAVNDAGVAVGYVTDEYLEIPTIWDPISGMQLLPSYCDTCDGRAVDVNEAGWVVGWVELPGSHDTYGFLYVPTSSPVLPPLELDYGMNLIGLAPMYPGEGTWQSFIGGEILGGGLFQTIGINDLNQVVLNLRIGPTEERAFLWLLDPAWGLDPGLYQLDDLIDTVSFGQNVGEPTHQLDFPGDITNSGHILAYAYPTNPNGGDYEYFVDLFPTGYVPDDRIQPIVADLFVAPVEVDDAWEDLDPVNTFDGHLVQREPEDLRSGAVGFRRRYSSRDVVSMLDGGPLGPGWRHGFQWALDVQGATALLVSPAGERIAFDDEDQDGVLNPTDPGRAGYQLLDTASGFEVLVPLPRQVLRFDDTLRLVAIDDTRGQVLSLTYTGDELTRVVDSHGNGLDLTWTGGRISQVSDGVRSVSFGYDADGLLTSFTDALGEATTYRYDAGGMLEAVVPPEGVAPWTSLYDGHQVVEQTDADGNPWTFSYDDGGVPDQTAIVDPLGNATLHQYNEVGQLLWALDPLGNETTLLYDADGERSGSTNPLGGDTLYQRDPLSGRRASTLLPNGTSLQTTYEPWDLNGLTAYDATQTVLPDGSVITEDWQRDASGASVARVDQDGYTTLLDYDPLGRPVQTTNADGGVTTATHHPDGRLAGATSSDGESVTVEHADVGTDRLTTIAYPDGTTVEILRDANRQLLRRTLSSSDPADPPLERAYTWDGNGNPVSTTEPDGRSASFVWDAMGRLSEWTDPAGGVHTYAYDERGLPSQVVDPTGATTDLAYDEAGRPAQLTDAHGQTWTLAYDGEGRLVSRTAPDGAATTWVYDDATGEVLVTNPEGHTFRHERDAHGRVTAIEAPDGSITCFGYDARGYLADAAIPCATPLVTASYERNGLGRLTGVIDPNQQRWEKQYDPFGLLTATVDPLGQVDSYAYDGMNRLSVVTWANGDQRTLEYDAYGRLSRHTTTSAAGAPEVLDLTWDTAGRPMTVGDHALAFDANGNLGAFDDLSFGSDAAGRLQTVTLSPGIEITYVYDRGRLVGVQDWLGGGVDFTHDALGRVSEVGRSNGVVTSLAYDAAGRVTRIDEAADAPLASTEIGWTAAGLIDSVQRTNHALPTPALGSPPARTFDAASQIEGVSYDERGRPLADGTRTWAWSASDRLLSTTEAGQTTTFEYDAFGSLVARIDASGSTRWRWSYAHAVPCPVEQDADGVVTYFVCTPDGELLYAIDAATGQRSFFHYDETGNTRLLTDDSGAVTASYAYLPFGQVVGGEGAADNPFTYSGRYGVIDHPGTDLFHMRRRVYDAATQRFLTRDPVQTHRDPRSIAPYVYAANDPVRLIDPMGAAPEEANAGGIDARSVVDTLLNVNTNATRAAELGLNKAADHLVDEARQVRRWADVGQSRTDRVADLWKRVQRLEEFNEHNRDLLAGAGDLAGTALAAWDARNDLNAVHSRTLSCQDLVLALYEDYLDAVCLSLVDGSISPDRADELRALAEADFERHLDECESVGWIDTLLVSAEFTEGTLSGAIHAELQWAYSGVKGALSSLGIDNPFVSDAAADGILDSREEVVGGLTRLYDFYGY